MASIARQYDDGEIVKKLGEVKPRLNFGDARIEAVAAEAPVENGMRVVRVTLAFGLSDDEFEHVFDNPIG